jgi:hypothetical protein
VIDWQDTPIIELPVYRPVCGCGGTKFIHVRSAPTGDGETLQRVICERCSRRLRINRRSLPWQGNDDLDDL